MSVDAVRYNGTIHDFVLLNALRHVPSTEAAIEQINDGLRRHLTPATEQPATQCRRGGTRPPRRLGHIAVIPLRNTDVQNGSCSEGRSLFDFST